MRYRYLCGQGHGSQRCSFDDPKLHRSELPLGGAVSPCGGEHRFPLYHGASAQKVVI